LQIGRTLYHLFLLFSGLKAFKEEYEVKKAIVVCTEPLPRIVDTILILPWKDFLEKLWAGQII
jgi:hypothetical protein